MDHVQVRRLLDDLAMAVVEIRWEDLGSLLPITEACQSLRRADLAGPAGERVRTIATDLTGLVDSLYMLEPAAARQRGAVLSRAVAAMQALIDGADPASIVVEGLGAAGEAAAPPIDAALLNEFITKQTSALAEVEQGLLAIEKGDRSQQRQMKGLLHTFKGEAGVLDLPPLEALAHAMEDALADGGSGPARTDLLLEAVDRLRSGLLDLAAGTDLSPVDDLCRDLRAPAKGSAKATGKPTAKGGDDLMPSESYAKGHDDEGLEFNRDPKEVAEFLAEVGEHMETSDAKLLELEAGHADAETLNCLFRAFHTVKGLAGFFGAHIIQKVAHEAENLLDRARQGQIDLAGGCADVVFESVDLIRGQVTDLKHYVESGERPTRKVELSALIARIRAVASGQVAAGEGRKVAVEGEALTAALVATGTISREQLTKALDKRQIDVHDATAVAKALVSEGVASAKDVAQALRSARDAGGAQLREAVKVDADRLDRVLDLIGEMVIAQSMVSQAVSRAGADPSTLTRLGQVDKLTRELQALGTSLRMVSVRSAFQRMARLVRDLSRKLDKPVELVTSGDDTELDKTVVDRIGDPLVHMVRNSLDHGLESAEERTAAGKPATGRIELRAFHKGGSIYLEIEDDGRGLNRDKILAKAKAQGLVPADAEPTDREIWQYIFLPGFSTAAVVTEVSGRGVGMDVVKRAIEALRGTVEITTRPGQGTCFSIRLPLTLAVIDGMVVSVGTERYIVPTLSVVTSLRPEAGDLSTVLGRGEMLKWQGRLLPLFRMGRLFGASNSRHDATEALAMVVEDEGRQVAVLVDALLGQQQVVIKNLGAAFKQIHGLSGGAIMPDGSVGLIVDVAGLVRLTQDANPPPETAAPAARTQGVTA